MDIPLDISNPDEIADYVTPYLMQTITTLHRVHGDTPAIQAMCFELSYYQALSARAGVTSAPVIPISEYNMKERVDQNPIPSPHPFLPDYQAIIIPSTQKLPPWHPPSIYVPGQSLMDDVVEAIRQTTLPVGANNLYLPPTTLKIQSFMAEMWPTKYDGTVAEAKGWRNSVNQCLTHGQGINFLAYSVDGKNKRHLLFERAFNGVCVLGSGQCKALHDLAKAAKKARAPPVPKAPVVQKPVQYTSGALTVAPPTNSSSSATSASSSTSSGYVRMSSRILSSSDLNPIPLSEIPLSELETECVMTSMENAKGADFFELMSGLSYS